MNKKVLLHDNAKQDDNCSIAKGRVTIKLAGTDKVLFEGWNKVVLSGAELLMRSLFYNGDALPAYKTLEEIVVTRANESSDQTIAVIGGGTQSSDKTNYYNPVDPTSTSGDIIDTADVPTLAVDSNGIYQVYPARALWFAVGNDGTEGGETFVVNAVNRSAPIGFTSYIPFIHGTIAEINEAAKLGYGLTFGSPDATVSERKYGSFAKQFDEIPTLHIVDTVPLTYPPDDTTYPSSLAYPNDYSNPQAYVEMKMSVTATDCRNYFSAINNTTRVINTISILTGIPKVVSGASNSNIFVPTYTRPFTKLNFPSESLADDSKGLDIVYQIYF